MSLWHALMVASAGAAGAAAQSQGLFVAPPQPQALGGSAFAPALSADELTLVFSSTRAGGLGGADLYETRRATVQSPWSSPINLTALNSASNDDRPALSTDGLELYFASDRGGGPGPSNLGVSRRSSPTAPWGAPALLPAPVNLMGVSTTDPALSPDGLRLWFAADGSGGSDLYSVERASVSAPWSNRQPFTTANSTFRDFAPHAESAGILFFASDRPGGAGASDIYLTWATGSAGWAVPVEVRDLDTAGADSHAAIGKRTGRAYVSTGASPSFAISAWCPPRDPPDAMGRPGAISVLPVQGGMAPFFAKVYAFDVRVGSTVAIDWNNWRNPPPPDDGYLFFGLAVPPLPIVELRLPGFSGGFDLTPSLVFHTQRYPVPSIGPVPTPVPIPANPALVGLVVYGQLALVYRATLTGAFSQVLRLRVVP